MIVFEPLHIRNEIIVGTVYFILFFLVNSWIIKKIFPELIASNYRILQLGLLLRFFSSIAFGIIHLVIYKNPVSDTGNYHLFSLYWLRFIQEHDVQFALKHIFSMDSTDFLTYLNSKNVLLTLRDSFCIHPQLLIVQLGAFINFFSMNSYVAKSIVFASIGFMGILMILKTMMIQFPQTPIKLLILPLFFVPSIAFWTSGYMKEPICMLAIGYIIYSYFNIVTQKKIHFNLIGCVVFFSLLLGFVKIFLLLILLVSLAIFTILHFMYKLSFTRKNILILIPVYLFLIALSYSLFNNEHLGVYSLDRVIESAHTKFMLIHNTDTKAGSSYASCLDGTDVKSVILSIPKALNTAMFRPYIWESNNALSLLSSLESTVVLCATFCTLGLLLIRKRLFYLIDTPAILFMLILSITYFYFVAISSSNFGTLVRYKTVYMPFYLIALIVTASRAYTQHNKSVN